MKKYFSILVNLAVAFSMILMLFAFQPGVNNAAAEPLAQEAQPDGVEEELLPPLAVQSTKLSKEAALLKIDPALREIARAGAKGESIDVMVSVAGSANLDKYLTDSVARPYALAGVHTIVGKAFANDLVKIAQEPGVVSIVSGALKELERPYDPQLDRGVDLEANRARIDALRANELTWSEAEANAKDAQVQDWFDVQDGHKSAKAWEKGFTGDGVILGVIDDGIDFGHPDLMGTYAWVTDESSPYYGWPMAFSQASTQYFFYDVYYGTNYIASGANSSRWSDTQETFESSTPFGGGTGTYWFQPLGSGVAYEYTFSATSQSGFYKIGSFPEMNLAALYGHRVAVLVADENAAGVYDTVYVDLDNDKDFSDEKPVTQDSPEIWRDMDGDGYTDISGGLLAWISDGSNTPPVADWLWGVSCGMSSSTMNGCPDSGELLVFAGAFRAGYTHGTQCASNVAAQGVVNEGLTAQPFRIGGMVQGAAPEVGLMDFGDFYVTFYDEDHYMVAALGYDGIPDSGDEIQITTNSYGSFRQMWGSWGYTGRLLTAINLTIGPTTAYVFSAGNEGPGYGPQEGDGSPTTIQAGSSTQYGTTNWDSIVSADQIVYGDPNSFFSKGPNRDGSSGLDVLANGGRGAGDEGINYYGYNGATSWATWGGTSRSAPVAGGNLALVYQAYQNRYGEWPTWQQAKALLKSGATNSVSSPFYQGGGVVNADRATDLAAGIYGVYAMPDEWQVGDWEGEQYLNFAKVAWAGNAYTQTYTVANPSGYEMEVDLSDGVMTLMSSTELTFTTSSQAEESSFNFHAPDYLMQMDASMIPADAELMVVRYVHPYDTFDPNYTFTPNPSSSWRFMLYNWTDVNGDGMLWEDTNGNGVVNHVDNLALGQDNDGFYRPDFDDPGTEIQQGEYIRVDYEFGGLAVPIAVHDPLARMSDGYFFGFQHRYNDGTVDQTTFKIGVEFYKRADWAWLSLSDSMLTIPPESEATFVATLDLPADTEPGAYEGVIYMFTDGDYYHPEHETALPVVVNVITDLPDGGSFTLGGGPMADTLYQNSWTNGYFNWYGGGWTGAGDWRHYFFNVDDADLENSNLLIHTSWDDGYPTDINTWLLGPTYDCASNGVGCAWPNPGLGAPWPSVFGPYTLQPIASSGPFLAGAAYPFDTSTGGPDDWIMSPLDMAGLHEIALHNVLYSGEELAAQFQVDVGTIDAEAVMDPAVGVAEFGSINAEVYTDTGELDLEITPSIEIPDLYASLSGGLATDHQDRTTTITDSGQCGAGAACADTVWETVNVNEVGTTELLVYIPMPPGEDVDLFVYFDINENNVWDTGIDPLVGASTNSAGNDDFVSVSNPQVGTYLVGILGWDISVPTLDLDWFTEITYPGPLPTETLDVYNAPVTITQDAPFDPTTASYSMTVTTNERAAALYVELSSIPAGNDVDVYVSDETGIIVQSQTNGSGNEYIEIFPPAGEYRFPEGKEFTIWVHGFNVPGGPITPNLHVWWDVLNIWLSATHPDVYVSAIGAGETVSVTVNFEKEGWLPGDPDLSARLVVGPSVLPGAFDELVILERTDPPTPGWDWSEVLYSVNVEAQRGTPPYYYYYNFPGDSTTSIAAPGDLLTYTLRVENTSVYTSSTLAPFLPDYNAFGGGLSAFSFNEFVYTPTVGTTYTTTVPGFGHRVYWTGDLGPGEAIEVIYNVVVDNPAWSLYDFGGTGIREAIWLGGGYIGQYRPTDPNVWSFWDYTPFSTEGSYKMSSPEVAGPGEALTYSFSLANPSAEDTDVFFYDELPAEVTFVSAPPDVSYDPVAHALTWTGTLPGTSLETTDFDVEVTVNPDVEEGTWIYNEATISLKFMGVPVDYLWTETFVDDGLDPDLVVEKTVDSLLAPVGTQLEYTIMLENQGTETAFNAMLQDAVPSMLDVDEASITGGAMYEDGVLHWMGDLGVGESKTFTFSATINNTATANFAIINPAEAWADNMWWSVFNSALTEVQGMTEVYMPIIIK